MTWNPLRNVNCTSSSISNHCAVCCRPSDGDGSLRPLQAEAFSRQMLNDVHLYQRKAEVYVFMSSSSSSRLVVDLYSASRSASNALLVPIALRKDEFSEPSVLRAGSGDSLEASSIPSDPKQKTPDDQTCCDGVVVEQWVVFVQVLLVCHPHYASFPQQRPSNLIDSPRFRVTTMVKPRSDQVGGVAQLLGRRSLAGGLSLI